MTNQEEQQIIRKLKAQKATVRPSRALLTRILAQLPADSKTQWEQYFWWLRVAIPAGVALLIGVVLFNAQGDPAQAPQEPAEVSLRQALSDQQEQVQSVSSLAEEEEALEQTFEQQESFFEDELLIGEVTLSDF